MNGKAYFTTLARYHRWAYRCLYEQVELASDEDYRADLGLFFGSIHGTLNHLLLVDRLWQDRLRGVPTGKVNLAAELESDRARLHDAILAQCDRFIEDVAVMPEEVIDADMAFVNSQGESHAFPAGLLVAHVINHATHHRGHVSAALTQLGIEAPVMDIPYFLVEETAAGRM